jgi:hypothetical protein
MHTVLLIPDGVGVRNFVLGDFLGELRRLGRVTILHDLPASVVELPELRQWPEIEWRPLPAYKEDPVAYQLRRALLFSHMYWGNTFGMRCVLRQSRPTGSLKSRMARHAAMLAGRLAATQAGIQMLDRQQRCAGCEADAGGAEARHCVLLAPAPARGSSIRGSGAGWGCPDGQLHLLVGQPPLQGPHRHALRPFPGLERPDALGDAPLLPGCEGGARACRRDAAV